MSIIIGIDHGYYAIKTAHCSFPAGLTSYEEMYHDPQLFFLLGKTLCVEHTTPEGYAQFMQATRQPPHQEQER